MAGLAEFGAMAGVGVNEANRLNNDAYDTGQRHAANAQLQALRQQALDAEALRHEAQQRGAGGVGNMIMPSPNIAPGYQGQYNEPAPTPRPQEEINWPVNTPRRQQPTNPQIGLPPQTPSTAVVPPGFTQPPVNGRPSPTPQRQPYGSNGRGLNFSFKPPLGDISPAIRPSQSDVRKFDAETNSVEVKPYNDGNIQSAPLPPSTAPGGGVFMPSPGVSTPSGQGLGGNAYVPQARQDEMDAERAKILMQEISDNPQDEPALGREIGQIQDGFRKRGYPESQIGLPVPDPSGSKYGGHMPLPKELTTGPTAYNEVPATAPQVGAAPAPLPTGSPHAGPYDDTRAAPAAAAAPTEPAGPAVSNNLPAGQEFFGGQQQGHQHYAYYDQLASQMAQMAKMHMLSGDPDRAMQAVGQANMARLEQYNILAMEGLHSAQRGDPTQLLSVMNFYDPGAGYSIRGMHDGNVEVLSNGRTLGRMSQGAFIGSAQELVNKAYYDQMMALRMHMLQKQYDVGLDTQGKMAVADVEGSWKVREMEVFARSKGLTPTVDSANQQVYVHGVGPDGKTIFGVVKPGVPIGGNPKLLTAPTIEMVQ